MNPKISELLERIREIEEEVEQEVQRRRAELHADFEHRRIRFERDIRAHHRRLKTGLFKYLRTAELRNVITAPLIYAVFFPLVAADIAVSLYQYLCFPLYGISCVRRRDYIEFDRVHLGYLNLIEKINCMYCSYANGLTAYMTEVIGRTEQYWCPIKHARRVRQTHAYYRDFVDFGDAEAYQHELAHLRAKLGRLDNSDRQ